MPVNNTIQLRKGSASLWTSTNPILASGEPGFDTTNKILKIGDGINTWSNLTSIAISGTAGGDLAGNFPNPTLVAVGSSGTYTKVTTDSKGRVTSGTTLLSSDLPTNSQVATNLYLWSNFR
jgi:hypothetical protein